MAARRNARSVCIGQSGRNRCAVFRRTLRQTRVRAMHRTRFRENRSSEDYCLLAGRTRTMDSAMDIGRRIRTVAIGSLGTVGLEVARRIDAGELDGLTLSVVSARDHARARGPRREDPAESAPFESTRPPPQPGVCPATLRYSAETCHRSALQTTRQDPLDEVLLAEQVDDQGRNDGEHDPGEHH